MAAAERAGRRIVELVAEDLKPSQILTKAAFENAITTLMALGGSTNAVIHLLAIAGRVGVDLTLGDFDRLSRQTPMLVNVKPSGEFLMEDLFEAGGVPAVMKEILPLLHTDAITVTGHSIGSNVSSAECLNHKVIRSFSDPIHQEGGIVVLHGNLAPDGAVLKQTAASPDLLTHTGRAVVFENYEDMHVRINHPDLPVDADSILVLKNAGPLGGPGFPEWGQIPLPEKLIRAGITDVVRISDARMSGTSFGTVVLHIAPESAIGGPLAAVRDGDRISLDVPNRKIDLRISEEEFAARLAAFSRPAPHYERGYGKLFLDHVTQANHGCDFDFLRAK
jgi:dihydroxy-acid dehydratase